MIYQLVVALSIAAATSASLYTEDHAQQKSLWEAFKQEHSKSYSTFEEESRRFYLFVENLKVADQRNADEKKVGGSATHGVTKYSDLSQVEFETNFLTSDYTMRSTDREVSADIAPPQSGATSVDWSGKYTTPVKDQGYCGSCWAFSATEQIESDAIMAGVATTSIRLSAEQITQCDSTSSGCNGGWTEHAYNYVKSKGGLESEADYPYTSKDGTTGTCKANSSKAQIKITGYTTISGETNMSNYMLAHGPLSVCLDASKWNSYTGGIVSSCGNRVDHCVQAVGVNTASGGYWKVRNSWGTGWGEAGYIRLAYGKNMCAITSDPTHVTGVSK